MDNGDMPAMPAKIMEQVSSRHSMQTEATGLTKREHFAAMAMQGLITLKGSGCMDKDITAIQCVRMADALLKELGESK